MSQSIFVRYLSVFSLGVVLASLGAGCAAADASDDGEGEVFDEESSGEPVESTASAQSTRKGCWSDTKNRRVAHGEYVTSKYTGGVFQCRNGRWYSMP
jgi:hypothetical protein